jgi:thiosulfate/3-mercaptopyruvate sulfurtransferase
MRRLFLVFVVAASLLTSAGAGMAAEWANPDFLVTPETVAQNIMKADWVVVDCRKLEDYAKGHIPGAISLGKPCKKALRDATSRAFTSAAKYDGMLGKAGIGSDMHVVFYADAKTKSLDSAHIAFWVLEYLGHNKTHLLNDGLEGWVAAGKKLDAAPTIKPAATFKTKFVRSRIATTDEILKIAKGQVKGVQLVDARTKGEHEGEDIRSVRGGRIPHTTLHVSDKDTYDKVLDPKTGKNTKATGVISPGTVAPLYASLDKNKRTIAYCQTGSRSTLTYLQMRLLGYKDPANYDDSWIIYGAIDKFPAEAESRIDLSRIKKLEDDLKKLQEKLEAKEEKH